MADKSDDKAEIKEEANADRTVEDEVNANNIFSAMTLFRISVAVESRLAVERSCFVLRDVLLSYMLARRNLLKERNLKSSFRTTLRYSASPTNVMIPRFVGNQTNR